MRVCDAVHIFAPLQKKMCVQRGVAHTRRLIDFWCVDDVTEDGINNVKLTQYFWNENYWNRLGASLVCCDK